MVWDLTHYVDGIATRVAVKRLTVGDGVRIDSEQDAISRRDDLEGRALLNLRQLPLWAVATVRAERAPLAEAPPARDGGYDFPDDLLWEPIPLTEAAYLSLDELLLWAWLGEILTKNPHRNTSYEALKKALSRVTPATASAAPSNGSATPDSSSEPIRSAG
jgi:hypothetical protein